MQETATPAAARSARTAPPEAVGPAVPADGRAARALRTREAIVDACIALVEEGDLRPTAPRVAERAGVSVRSVFQHFTDLPALHIAVTERIAERVAALVVPIDPELPLDDRIARFVDERTHLLEVMTPFRVAASVHGPFAPEIRRAIQAGSALLRDEVGRVFALELGVVPAPARGEVLDALATATSAATWGTLRSEWDADPARARGVMARLIRAILADAST